MTTSSRPSTPKETTDHLPGQYLSHARAWTLPVLTALATLAVLVVVAAALAATAPSYAAPQVSEIRAVTPAASLYNKAVYLQSTTANGYVEDCSGSLVGPSTVLTAGHCLGPTTKHGTYLGRAVSVQAWVGHHRSTGDKNSWAYHCTGEQAWSRGHGPDFATDDWALVQLTACTAPSRAAMSAPVGLMVGYHGVRAYRTSASTAHVFTGYPSPGHGRLTRAVFFPSDTNPAEAYLKYGNSVAKFSHTTGFELAPGASGGPMLTSTGGGRYDVVAVNNLSYDHQSYFRHVDAEIVDAVIGARSNDFPSGSWRLK